MVNAGKGINIERLKYEMRQNKIENNPVNVYLKSILSDDSKKNPTQMEDWSILSDHVKYVKYDRSGTFRKLNVDILNYCQNKDL